MLRRILVPVDGSKLAAVAIPVAVSLARASKAQLRFVMVHEPECSSLPAYQLAGAAPHGPDERRERDATYLGEVLERLDGPDRFRATAQFVDGMAAPTLAKEITSWEPDL